MLTPLFSQTDREGQASIAAFLDTFQRLGWADGRNVRIEYRWGDGDPERTKTAAAELVRSAPDAIVVAGGAVRISSEIQHARRDARISRTELIGCSGYALCTAAPANVMQLTIVSLMIAV
jgi:ABC-type branched-subunit amino acid transport system substrate-binding protein